MRAVSVAGLAAAEIPRPARSVLPPVAEREIGNMLKREIDGLRDGSIEDTYGWFTPVGSAVTA